MRVFFDLGSLPRHFRLVYFPLRLRGQIGAGPHRQRAGQRASQAGGQDHFTAAGIARHPGHDAEHRTQPVVDAVNRVANPAGSAHMPTLATKNRVERRPRGRHGAARQRAQNHGMVALFVFGVRRDLSVRRIAEPRHQQVVLGFGLIFFLLEPMEHDVWVGDPLEP